MIGGVVLLELSLIAALLRGTIGDVLKCNRPLNFSFDTHANGIADVYNGNLIIKLDYKKMEFYGYETSKFVTIRGRDVTVEFDGTYTDKYMPAWIDPEIRVFKDIFNEGITGNAQRLPLNDTTYKIYNCRLMLLPVAEENPPIPDDEIISRPSTLTITRKSVRRLAESCLESHVCIKYETINQWEFIENSNTEKFCFSPDGPGSLADLVARVPSVPKADLGVFQDIINKIGDVALVEGIAALDQVNGSVKLPNITEKFTTGKGIFTAHGLLETTGGIFRDLTTLQRSENIEITRAGNKYSASASIQMSTAELHFSNYKLSYGIIKLDGEFDIRVAGVKLQAAASIDYSQKPCLPRIEKIKVSELGKVDVAFTGLGIFNSVLGTVVDGIIRFLKVLLTRLLEEELMKMAGDAFKDFDCEKFRPG